MVRRTRNARLEMTWLTVANACKQELKRGQVTVPAGSESYAVAVNAVNADYQAVVTPYWNANGVEILGKTASTLTVGFANPAPAGGALLDWLIYGI